MIRFSISKNLYVVSHACGGTAKEILHEGVCTEAGMPVIIGLEAKGMRGSDSGNCGQFLEQKKNTNPPIEDSPMVNFVLRFFFFFFFLCYVFQQELTDNYFYESAEKISFFFEGTHVPVNLELFIIGIIIYLPL